MVNTADIPTPDSRLELELSAARSSLLAASVHAKSPHYYDDTHPLAGLAHPGFPFLLYFEALEGGSRSASPLPSVQAWVDLKLNERLRVGRRLTSLGKIVATGDLPPGAAYVRRFEVTGSDGRALAELSACSMVPGQRWDQPGGADVGATWDWMNDSTRWTSEFRVEAWEAHIFAECTGTFNPIHLSRAAADRAGLRDRPYQGIATLLRSVSLLVEKEFGVEEDIRRIAGVFRRPVFPNTTVRVACTGRRTTPDGVSVWFRAIDEDGSPFIERGLVETASRNDAPEVPALA